MIAPPTLTNNRTDSGGGSVQPVSLRETTLPSVQKSGEYEMLRGAWNGHPLFCLENIYRAYCRCRRRKRGTHNALAFEQNLEENVLALHEELTAGTYRPGRSMAFLVERPKQREIFAADFRDRVVHHILVGYLEPEWEKRFIHDSYACRKGKGTHKGVERLRAFTRKVTANGTRRAWYLQLDVRGYFVTLDRNILYERLTAHEPDPIVLWLIRVILFHESTCNCRFRDARRSDFDRLPPHKTLFKARSSCGLPIGNLTSQFFANVYLDALDQFVKHRLRVKYYLRYCDDMVILSKDKKELEQWEEKIKIFLAHRLRLQLNERRKLRPVPDGIDFLGYIVRPDYLLVRRRVVLALRERLARTDEALRGLGMAAYHGGRGIFPWPWPLIEKVRQWLNSYLEHIKKTSGYRLIMGLRNRFAWLDEYFVWEDGKVVLRYPIPRFTLRFSQQRRWFRDHLPGHVLMIRQGGFWEMTFASCGIAGKHNAESLATITTKVQSLRRNAQLVGRKWPCRFHHRRLREVKALLWESGLAVAWIGETDRHVCNIAERALIYRWSEDKSHRD
jgi:retron-type reverse transcriptase